MRAGRIVTFLFAGVVLPANAHHEDERNTDLPALERWLRRAADSAGFSGVIRIERGGKVLLERVYAPARRTTLTTESAIWLASTKAWMSTVCVALGFACLKSSSERIT